MSIHFSGIVPSENNKSENNKFVLVENGEPRYVLVPWQEFEMMRSVAAKRRVSFAEVADEVLDIPAFAPVRNRFAPFAVDAEKIRLEDLPVQ